MKETQKAYLAGVIDGEGCIGINKTTNKSVRHKHPYYQVRLRIAMTTEEPIKSIESWCGGIVSLTKRKGNSKPIFEWLLLNDKAVAMLQLIKPYLRVKRKQTEIAINFRDYYHTHSGYGRAETPIEVSRQREKYFQEMKQLNKRGKI